MCAQLASLSRTSARVNDGLTKKLTRSLAAHLPRIDLVLPCTPREFHTMASSTMTQNKATRCHDPADPMYSQVARCLHGDAMDLQHLLTLLVAFHPLVAGPGRARQERPRKSLIAWLVYTEIKVCMTPGWVDISLNFYFCMPLDDMSAWSSGTDSATMMSLPPSHDATQRGSLNREVRIRRPLLCLWGLNV